MRLYLRLLVKEDGMNPHKDAAHTHTHAPIFVCASINNRELERNARTDGEKPSFSNKEGDFGLVEFLYKRLALIQDIISQQMVGKN